MSAQLGLPTALARRGLRVELVPGWEHRSAGSFAPGGAVCHWTAGPQTGDRPSLNVCVNGHSTLAGPLCNVFLTRSGVAVVVAAGRANHAGEGSWRGMVGNSSMFGTEAENSGYDPWTDAQRDAYPRINAAYLDLLGSTDVGLICGHNEWAPTRKIDIRTYPMSAMRSQVAAVLAGEDELSAADVKAINDNTNSRLNVINKDAATRHAETLARLTALEAAVDADPDNSVTQDMLNLAVATGLAGASITVTPPVEGTA